jgi:hypothetical protein
MASSRLLQLAKNGKQIENAYKIIHYFTKYDKIVSGMLPRSSLNMQFRTAYKLVTDPLGSEPTTNQEIVDRAGDHLLLTEIFRGNS